MASIAFGCYFTFFALALVMRGLVQYIRTGSTGIRGFADRRWPDLLAGTGLAVAQVLLVTGMYLSTTLPPAIVIAAGLALFGFGLIGTLIAQFGMGDSWRVGINPQESTALITHGVYRYVRNPIYAFMVVAFVGLAILTSHALAWVSVVILTLSLELQVRFVEEPYLLTRMGREYRDYLARVGRFVPGTGKMEIS